MRHVVVVVLVVLGSLLLWRFWMMDGESHEIDRRHMYARAVDFIVASRATDATARRFYISWPIDTPAAERPSELAAAFAQGEGGSGPVTAPCPLTGAEMKRAGPGRCWLTFPEDHRRPAVCALIPCIVVSLPDDLAANHVLLRDLHAGHLRRVACIARSSDPQADWREGMRSVRDCGPSRFLTGPVFLATSGRSPGSTRYLMIG